MPVQSSINGVDKDLVKKSLESTAKILAVAPARIYYAHPTPDSWTYSGLQGALAFSRDKNSEIPYLRLVDLDGTRGIIWEHELYEGFELNEDRPFFQSFPGDVSYSIVSHATFIVVLIGFCRIVWLGLFTPTKRMLRPFSSR